MMEKIYIKFYQNLHKAFQGKNFVFDSMLNFAFAATIIYFIFFQLALPLWHDEIYQLWMVSKDFDSIITTTRADPNYPLQSIIYKLFYDFFSFKNFENLVVLHFLSLFTILLSLFLLRKVFSYKKIIMLAFILFSSEFFLRFFFELRSYGFIFSCSALFSSSYLLTKLKGDNFYCYLLYTSGLFLSALHAIAGLFVVSVMLKFLFENQSLLKRFSALILIFISCIFVLIFSSESIILNNNFHIDSYYVHIRNTGAFMIPLIVVGIFLVTSKPKHFFNQILIDISPVIFSMIIIYTYSFISSPFFQGRYFTAFFPFLSLFLIKHIDTKYFISLKIVSLLLVIFLYGPRAISPYSNFEGIIESSHKPQCAETPLFFENQTGLDSKIIFQSEFIPIIYYTAEDYYSDIQRPILSAKDTIAWWKDNYQNNNCKVIGISIGDITQGPSSLSAEKNLISPSRKLVDGCNKNGCGAVWTIE
mgnify:FL=1|jgi:hypothetical protein